ncbi:hypothetical protein VTL71DRAFT_15713 [Oculimacula yallundae]|uniref:Uncharacterized protein n=1 Tax=Oculimacula yallundae TaxID=86028 RepID=A0ABR4CD68_9HELO
MAYYNPLLYIYRSNKGRLLLRGPLIQPLYLDQPKTNVAYPLSIFSDSNIKTGVDSTD